MPYWHMNCIMWYMQHRKCLYIENVYHKLYARDAQFSAHGGQVAQYLLLNFSIPVELSKNADLLAFLDYFACIT